MPRNPITNKTLFEELLYQKRRGMSSGNRRRTQSPKPQKWIYPHSIERKFFNNIKQWMKTLTDYAELILSANLNSWVLDYSLSTGRGDEKIKELEQTKEKLVLDQKINITLDPLSSLFTSASIREIDDEIEKIRQDAFPEELQVTIEELQAVAAKMAEEDLRTMIIDIGYDVSEQNAAQWTKFTEGLLGLKFFPTEPWEVDVINAWAQTNYNLITSLTDEYIKKLNLLVSEGVQNAATARTFEDAVKDMLKQSKLLSNKMINNRARLIARDQVGKLMEQFTARRQQDAGIEMYTWATAGDERVRPSHKKMQGKLCRWDDPTVYSDDKGKTWKKRSSIGGVELHPGRDNQCRCTAIPYFDDMIEDIDNTIMEENT